jgi:carbamoyl-phosphate synthase small subunit
VNPDSLDPRTIQVTHVNLNGGTVEGLAHQFLPAFSVQYHPEAAPGPKDSEYLFIRFLALMGRGDVEMVS